MEYIALLIGIILVLTGLYGIIVLKNIIKTIIAFSILDTGTHVIIVSIGYLKGRTAPIIDQAVKATEAVTKIVDPLPQALVLTAIVIGLGVTALMLAYAVKLYNQKKTLEFENFKELKW